MNTIKESKKGKKQEVVGAKRRETTGFLERKVYFMAFHFCGIVARLDDQGLDSRQG